jgi:hypothetical protein
VSRQSPKRVASETPSAGPNNCVNCGLARNEAEAFPEVYCIDRGTHNFGPNTESGKHRGILFSTRMVRSLLDGWKTQTRRLVNPSTMAVRLQNTVESDHALLPAGMMPRIVAKPGRHKARLNAGGAVTLSGFDLGVKPGEFDFVCPYADGQTQIADFPSRTGKGWRTAWQIRVAVDQYLWVRETWRLDGKRYVFRADDDNPDAHKWKPGIHLPRASSRITLEVRHVRIERLQEITEEDARAEGVRPFFEQFHNFGRDQRITTGELARDQPYRASYAVLWDEINGDRALWKSNPLVWVIDFKVHRKEAR